MSVVNLGEVLYVLLKQVDEQRARHFVQVLQMWQRWSRRMLLKPEERQR
jgi:hypothetical protein